MAESLAVLIYTARQALLKARKEAEASGSPEQVRAIGEAADWLEYAGRDGKDTYVLPRSGS